MPMKMFISKRSRAWLAVALIVGVLLVDQIIKIAVKTHMTLGSYGQIDVTDWMKICFVENQGMAFGMSFVGTTLLATFRVVAICALIYALVRAIQTSAKLGLIVCLALLVAGASGNIIDNAFYGLVFTESGVLPGEVASLVPFGQGYGDFMSGRVVDMFYFPLFTWPTSFPLVGGDVFFGAIFNFADAVISCAAVALVLFYHSSESWYVSGKMAAH